MDVLGGREIRAEVLRVLHKLTCGMPALSADDLHGQPLTPAERGLAEAASDYDLALLNALLDVEAERRREQWAALERLLVYCQFSNGDLEARIVALPDGAFGRAALDLWALGWITSTTQ
jgi:hypothetical protein